MVSKKEEVIQKASKTLQKKFDLSSFKEKKGFGAENTKYKPQAWIPLDKAWQDVLSLPGIPQGHITVLRGWSDTGKTTALIETAVSCQKKGILPVLIITESKFSWEYCKKMGFEVQEKVDPDTGEVIGYDGFFLYADRSSLNTIEDVAQYIIDLLDEQAKGNLPYDLCFLWDSVGSVPCRMSVEAKNINAQWDAAALSNNFAKFIDQRIVLSRKQSSPYTNTLVAITKIWVSPPETPLSSPRVNSKGGSALIFDSSLIILFGNIANAGTSKLIAISGGKTYEWGKRTKVSIEKNHIGGLSSKGNLIMTPTGFIKADEKSQLAYRNEHCEEWKEYLGSQDFTMGEEATDGEYINDLG